MKKHRPDTAPPSRPRDLLPSILQRWPTILVVGYSLAAFSWTMPVSLFPPKPIIDQVARGPLLLLGLWQAWDMFSPDPRTTDICVEMRCTNRDGTSDRRMLSDMVAMGFYERWQKDRWRKYFNDHLRLDDERSRSRNTPCDGCGRRETIRR